MQWIKTDGGRSKYFKGEADDCVVRSIALATGRNYREIYDVLKAKMGKGKSPRNGVHKKTYHDFILSLGFEWVPYMGVGTGCTIHLKKEELPDGTMICRLSKHLCCVREHTIFDSHHPGSNRCVYGVYLKRSK